MKYRVFLCCDGYLIPSNPSGFYHNYNNGVLVRAYSLSPLKPQRGRTEFESYVLFFAFNTIPHYCGYEIRKILRFHYLETTYVSLY